MPLGLAPLPVVLPGLVVELVGPPELLPLAPAALPAPAPPPAPPAPPPPPPPPWANTAVLSNKADTSARGKSLVRNISDLTALSTQKRPPRNRSEYFECAAKGSGALLHETGLSKKCTRAVVDGV